MDAKPSKLDINTFREAVYAIVRMIPHGRASNYVAIAKATGYPNQARMVGNIMASCNSKLTGLAAHRVVNSIGKLTGRSAFGEGKMQKLLEAEGINISNNRIENWETIFWNPLNEIKL